MPDFNTDESIHSFSGARSKTDVGDWIVQASTKDSAFIQAAGIDSPGIAASPAIALEIVDLLKKAGLGTQFPCFTGTKVQILTQRRYAARCCAQLGLQPEEGRYNSAQEG